MLLSNISMENLLRILIWAGSLLYGPDMEILRSRTIYIEDGMISGIYSGFSNTTADIVIDLRQGVVMPPLANLHVHSADIGFMELGSDLDIDSIVGEPYGAKYIFLKEKEHEIPRYVELFLETQRAAGVAYVGDFREGGLRGLLYGIEGSRGYGGIYIPMAMPLNVETGDLEGELVEILRMAKWIGVSSPHYYGWERLRLVDRVARDLGGYIASHVAETIETREEGDYEMIRDLDRLRLVVHGIYLTREELEELSSRGAGLAICPRSNMWFTKPPDLGSILDSGIRVGIGSDNGGWVKPDLWRDMETIALLARLQGVDLDPRRVIKMATSEGAEILGFRNYIEEGMQANIVGLKSQWLDLGSIANIEYAIIKRGGPESIRLFIFQGKLLSLDKVIIYR
jgi:cytosine/adenosine deaminase-related metal-dependent hydrolase